MLKGVIRRRLVKASEFDVGGHPRRDVEYVVCSVRSRRQREQRIVTNTGGQILSYERSR